MKSKSVLLLNERMTEPQSMDFCSGKIAYFTDGCPEDSSLNGDSLAIFPLNDNEGVMAIADGAGGTPGGNRASKLVLEVVSEQLYQSNQNLRDRILNGFEKANEKLLDLRTGAATTLFILELNKNQIRSYHAGDSMIMVVGQKGLQKFQTLPHSPVGYAQEAQVIKSELDVPEEDRQAISNFVGLSKMSVEVGSAMPLNINDTVILCSDGLTDNLNSSEISECIRKGDLLEAAQLLIQKARARMSNPKSIRSKPDDLSFILYRSVDR